MITNKVTCDQCTRDLSETTNSVDYRILLGNEYIPAVPDVAVTDMMIMPPFEQGKHHFCHVGCLKKWVGDL